MIIKDKFSNLYRKLKLMTYRNMFKRVKDKDEKLTSSEYFCLECISLMDKPTISQFAAFLDISSPNATYKVKTLIKKGFLTKEKSEKDKREYILLPTKKFFDIFSEKDEDEENLKVFKKDLNKHESKKVDKLIKLLQEEA